MLTRAGMRNPKVLAMAVLGLIFLVAAATGLLTRIDLQGLDQLLWLNAQQRAAVGLQPVGPLCCADLRKCGKSGRC